MTIKNTIIVIQMNFNKFKNQNTILEQIILHFNLI